MNADGHSTRMNADNKELPQKKYYCLSSVEDIHYRNPSTLLRV